MFLKKLAIENVRCVNQSSLTFTPALNLFVGDNGVGKTTILEAIYFLTRARSFRKGNILQLQRKNSRFMRVVGCIDSGDTDIPVGVERQGKDIKLKFNGESLPSLSMLTKQFLVSVINADTFQLMLGPASERRSFIDWGIFQSTPEYLLVQKNYAHILKQRNALLKTKPELVELSAWNDQLIDLGEIVSNYRQQFINQIGTSIQRVLKKISRDAADISINYERGWANSRSYRDVITSNIDYDIATGVTNAGPHRADIKLRVDGLNVAEQLSRGQTKIAVIALILGQLEFVKNIRNDHVRPIVLIDDLPSELDATHLHLVLQWLREADSQIFMTAIESNAIDVSKWQNSVVVNLAAEQPISVV